MTDDNSTEPGDAVKAAKFETVFAEIRDISGDNDALGRLMLDETLERDPEVAELLAAVQRRVRTHFETLVDDELRQIGYVPDRASEIPEALARAAALGAAKRLAGGTDADVEAVIRTAMEQHEK